MRQRGFEPLIISVPDSSKLFGFHKALMLADIVSWIFFGCFAPLCLLCGALALIDIQRGIIPNGLNLSIAGLGLLKAAVGGGIFDDRGRIRGRGHRAGVLAVAAA